MPFEPEYLPIQGLILLKTKVFEDSRGFFSELYRTDLFGSAGIPFTCEQINHSRSSHGVLRGLHYQLPPKAQAKLVCVTEGEIFDVAVDIRKGSSTFGRWFGMRLTSTDHSMLFIPEGFAHGFTVLSPYADVIYSCSNGYAPDLERGIIWDDPGLAINWPIARPVISRRDQEWPTFDKASSSL